MIDHKFNSNYKILIVSVVSILLVLIVTLTFAYYMVDNISNTFNITTRIENEVGTFIATGSNIELNITKDVMIESVSDDENAAVENNTFLNVEYLSGTDERLICSYDINYEWVSDNNSGPYNITNNEKKELTYEIYDGSNIPIITNNETNSEVNFVSSTDRTKHTLKTLYISNASKDEPTYQSYKIDTRFYNLIDDQSANAGKNWNVRFYVDNIICGIKSDIVYETLSGNGVEIIKGDNRNLEVRIDANYSRFTSGSAVYVDDNFVDPSNYTSESGSTIIKFKPEYVENLSVQNHIVKVEFNDGGVGEVTFKVLPVSVEINEPITNEIYKGKTLQLTGVTNSKIQNIEWISDDTEVATVDSNGVVTGIGVGKAHIKAKVGSTESEEVEINVKTNVYDVNIIDQNNKGETLGNRTVTCNILENTTINPKEGGYSGYISPNSEEIVCQEENNITLTYNAGTYDINITDTSSNGELGTRKESCTYGENTIVAVSSYTGYSSPEAQTIACDITNNVTYTYTPVEYTITVTDKSSNGSTLGTRNIACTYGVNTTVNAGTYTGYTSPSSTSVVCSTTNNLEMTYTPNTYDVTITYKSSNGSTLGTRTESCTYAESYTPTVTSYTGHTSPSTSAITCSTSNAKTYTYTANEYSVSINDKKPDGTVLGTRSDTCTYGTSYTAPTATNGTYTGYNAPSSVSAITCSSSNTVNISYVARTDMSVTINYKDANGTVIRTAGSDTCTYDSSKTVSPVSISGYTSPASQTFTCGSSNTVNFTYQFAYLSVKVQSLAGKTSGTGSVVNQTIGSYTNTIYTGANPNNYVTFNGEMWRIIGVYNQDTHGKSNQKLVKLIRNASLGSYAWDYKQKNVGSSTNTYGSNEWSDSQLMFLLNGSSAINQGKMYNGNVYKYSTTRVSGSYIQASRNGTGAYYNIVRINSGSYLTSSKETNKSVYVPASATTSSLTSKTGTLATTLSSTSQNMIESVTWHLGGYTSAAIPASSFYSNERSNNVYNSTSSTTRSTTWTGKVGLMYPSDYAYATAGGTSYTRNNCIGYNLSTWSSYADCYNNDWLLYVGATASAKGTATVQWTITPRSSVVYRPFYLNSNGILAVNNAYTSYAVRPVVYLKSSILFKGGSGTYSSPYTIST